MKKFNRLFIAGQTQVQVSGVEGWRLIKEIHVTRNWIRIEGIEGLFQRDHVTKFTNGINHAA